MQILEFDIDHSFTEVDDHTMIHSEYSYEIPASAFEPGRDIERSNNFMLLQKVNTNTALSGKLEIGTLTGGAAPVMCLTPAVQAAAYARTGVAGGRGASLRNPALAGYRR
ncbi:hypothetical protein ACIP5Y_05630 [Nocardia sp. NPDC088792]|uniref:hypothetical protein n=1 Tax=Nocardia sp. NPDC088792 TaxID=3364332 RepID=UPI0038052EAB